MLYPEQSHKILELAFQLHKELGCGFKEKVYQDAFEVLLKEHKIPYVREANMKLVYHGVELQHNYYYDFLCYDRIGIEIKALTELLGEHEAQIINYLHVSNHQLGLLLNFGKASLQYKWYPNHHYREQAAINRNKSID